MEYTAPRRLSDLSYSSSANQVCRDIYVLTNAVEGGCCILIGFQSGAPINILAGNLLRTHIRLI